MRYTTITIETTGDAVNTASLLELANPLFPTAELFEREMAGRGLLKSGDLIRWDVKAMEMESWSGRGFIHWLRKPKDPKSVSEQTLWHEANYGDGKVPFTCDQFYESLCVTELIFNRSGFVSQDGANWVLPTSSPLVSQIADLFAKRASEKAEIGKR